MKNSKGTGKTDMNLKRKQTDYFVITKKIWVCPSQYMYLVKFHPVNACHLLSRRAIPIYRDINYKSFPSLSISLTTKSMSDFRISRFVMIILKKLTCSSSGWYPINMVPALVIPSLIFGATFNVKVGMKRKKLSFDS